MNIFRIKKKSGTYSELLETYGLANTLHKIFDSLGIFDVDILITDKSLYYEVTTSVDVTEDMIGRLYYFPIFKYIRKIKGQDLVGISDYYDYASMEMKLEQIKKMRITDKEKKVLRKGVHDKYNLGNLYYVISNIEVVKLKKDKLEKHPFEKLYRNFHDNKDVFADMIREVLSYYSQTSYLPQIKLGKGHFEEKVTATQLYNPNQGKGINGTKANGVKGDNLDSLWIVETMKVSGALSDMICQPIEKYWTISVPTYKQVNYEFKNKLMLDFKKGLRNSTSIKNDVLNILFLTQKTIENSAFLKKRKKVKDIVGGLHTVYQKKMGHKPVVINIGYMQVPNFICIDSEEENQRWIEILKEQRTLINNLDENNEATLGLMKYRDFISASDINSFFDFSFWYATYLMRKSSDKKYIISVESLNNLYSSMDKPNLKLMEIIENRGFQAIAKAIRMSTVSLQYVPKNERKFEIRYGVAQTLQTKSKSSEDLATFIGEFISMYNAETARYEEKYGGKPLRANVREDELCDFYALLDSYSSRLIGALLASYGFALQTKKNNNENNDSEETIVEE